jgi:hypothetical protein
MVPVILLMCMLMIMDQGCRNMETAGTRFLDKLVFWFDKWLKTMNIIDRL